MIGHVFRFVGHSADQAFFIAGTDERKASVLYQVLFIANPVPDGLFSVVADFVQYSLQPGFFQEVIPVLCHDLSIGKTFVGFLKEPFRRNIQESPDAQDSGMIPARGDID